MHKSLFKCNFSLHICGKDVFDLILIKVHTWRLFECDYSHSLYSEQNWVDITIYCFNQLKDKQLYNIRIHSDLRVSLIQSDKANSCNRTGRMFSSF